MTLELQENILDITSADEIDLEDNSPNMVSQPKSMKRNLYPHQLSGIYMMEKREAIQKTTIENSSDRKIVLRTNIGIYADITGYGKTAAMIGLIVRDKMKWNTSNQYNHEYVSYAHGGGRIEQTITRKYYKLNATLILAGPSILKQWSEELSYTDLKFQMLTTRKKIDAIKDHVNDYDALLVSPTMYKYLLQDMGTYSWKRFVYDEPTHTKVPAMTQIIAGFYWFISATPHHLLYGGGGGRHTFLGSIFGYYMDTHIFNHLIVKNDDSFVKESYQIPETNHITYECYQPIYNMVQGIITDDISNMISAGNIDGAVRALGGNKTSNIMELVKSRLEEDLEEAELKIRRYSNRGTGFESHVTDWTQKKTTIENKLRQLDDRFKDALDQDCCICRDKLEKPIMLTCCQNIYCGQCILSWMNSRSSRNTCPMCRAPITKDTMIHIETEESQTTVQEEVPEKLSKPDTIYEIIKKKDTGKFIIFSEWDETFAPIYRLLDERAIPYAELIGHKTTREKNIESFKKGDIKVLFLNSRSNGAGINLQEATDIIMYHEMDECLSTQIIGRANRIGRKESLIVHHLV